MTNKEGCGNVTTRIERPDYRMLAAIACLTAALAFLMCLPAGPVKAQTILGLDDPMIEAIQDGNLDRVKSLVIQGGNPSITSVDGMNGIGIAARNGDYAMLDYLIQVDVPVNNSDDIGNTPLHWITEDGDYDIAGYLLDNGANVNVTNRNGMTPVMIATREGFVDLVDLYIDHGADLGVRDYTGRSVLDWARGSRAPGLEQLLIDAGAQ